MFGHRLCMPLVWSVRSPTRAGEGWGPSSAPAAPHRAEADNNSSIALAPPALSGTRRRHGRPLRSRSVALPYRTKQAASAHVRPPGRVGGGLPVPSSLVGSSVSPPPALLDYLRFLSKLPFVRSVRHAVTRAGRHVVAADMGTWLWSSARGSL
jgi:hypothetical protein